MINLLRLNTNLMKMKLEKTYELIQEIEEKEKAKEDDESKERTEKYS